MVYIRIELGNNRKDAKKVHEVAELLEENYPAASGKNYCLCRDNFERNSGIYFNSIEDEMDLIELTMESEYEKANEVISDCVKEYREENKEFSSDMTDDDIAENWIDESKPELFEYANELSNRYNELESMMDECIDFIDYTPAEDEKNIFPDRLHLNRAVYTDAEARELFVKLEADE